MFSDAARDCTVQRNSQVGAAQFGRPRKLLAIPPRRRVLPAVWRRLLWVLLLLLVASSNGDGGAAAAAGEEGVATIVLCSGCALDHLPGLLVWLQDRDYEFYDHLKVQFANGLSPVSPLWAVVPDGGDETIGADEVAVSRLDVETVEQMEAILTAQDFRRKPDYEIAAIRAERHRLVEQADRVIREMMMAEGPQQRPRQEQH